MGLPPVGVGPHIPSSNGTEQAARLRPFSAALGGVRTASGRGVEISSRRPAGRSTVPDAARWAGRSVRYGRAAPGCPARRASAPLGRRPDYTAITPRLLGDYSGAERTWRAPAARAARPPRAPSIPAVACQARQRRRPRHRVAPRGHGARASRRPPVHQLPVADSSAAARPNGAPRSDSGSCGTSERRRSKRRPPASSSHRRP